MQSVRLAVAEDLSAVNHIIVSSLRSKVGLVEEIGQYIVEAGGKRLRPVLALLAANALNYNGDKHHYFAAVVEFIHTATLLHDDVVDVSSLRRGRPTANAEYGNASSVLVGDFIYTRAFQQMVELDEPAILPLMAQATNQIAEGEVLQLVQAGQMSTTEEVYYDIINRKTAVLFEAACEGGGIIAGATSIQRQALADFGRHLGMAFQIADDILDYRGNAETMGKNVGDDLAEGKLTLPLIRLFTIGSPEQQKLVSEAIEQRSAASIETIYDAVIATKSLDYCEFVAAQHAKNAATALDVLPDSDFRHQMQRLIDLAIHRDH